MRHPNKTMIIDLLEELGVQTEICENSKINAPKNLRNPYRRSVLEIILERQERFMKSCDVNYRTIKEQEEDEEAKDER